MESWERLQVALLEHTDETTVDALEETIRPILQATEAGWSLTSGDDCDTKKIQQALLRTLTERVERVIHLSASNPVPDTRPEWADEELWENLLAYGPITKGELETLFVDSVPDDGYVSTIILDKLAEGLEMPKGLDEAYEAFSQEVCSTVRNIGLPETPQKCLEGGIDYILRILIACAANDNTDMLTKWKPLVEVIVAHPPTGKWGQDPNVWVALTA